MCVDAKLVIPIWNMKKLRTIGVCQSHTVIVIVIVVILLLAQKGNSFVVTIPYIQ